MPGTSQEQPFLETSSSELHRIPSDTPVDAQPAAESHPDIIASKSMELISYKNFSQFHHHSKSLAT